jgi:hypothetical protein
MAVRSADEMMPLSPSLSIPEAQLKTKESMTKSNQRPGDFIDGCRSTSNSATIYAPNVTSVENASEREPLKQAITEDNGAIDVTAGADEEAASSGVTNHPKVVRI